MRIQVTGPNGQIEEFEPPRMAGHEVISGRPLDEPGRRAYTESELVGRGRR